LSHSYSQNHLHVIFSTKDRQKLIAPAMRPRLWSYMAGIGRNHGILVLANGGIHRKKTYEQEFEGLLRKHRIPFDPKYVFG
jgi:hypothetical protein